MKQHQKQYCFGKFFRILFVMFLFCLIAPNSILANVFEEWSHRTALVFDNSAAAEDLIDFPVLVVLHPGCIDYTQINSDGSDIRFLDSDYTLLSYEIEQWNPNGYSYIWVKVPRIDARSKTDFIYLYWGNSDAADAQDPIAIWTNGYEGVWHLQNGFEDSTANLNHGINAGSVDTLGIIGNGQSFDGDGDFITLPNSESLNVMNGDYTLEGWFIPADIPKKEDPVSGGYYSIIGRQGWNIGLSYLWNQSLNIQHLLAGHSFAASVTAWAEFEPGTPMFATAVVNKISGTTLLYANGLLIEKVSWPPGSEADTVQEINPWLIGGAGTSGGYWLQHAHGIIDEARISSVARSSDWIRAQYKSMTGTFCSFQNVPAVVNRTPTEITASAVTFTCAVTSAAGGIPEVCICSGKRDGGSDPGQWEDCECPEHKSAGIYSVRKTELDSCKYFFRCFASNAMGKASAPETSQVVLADRLSLSIAEYPEALRNPLKGFRPGFIAWGSGSQNSVNHPYAGVIRDYIEWNQIENNASDGVERILDYCNSQWSDIETQNIKIIPRVYLEWPGRGTYWPADMTTGDYSSSQFKQRVVNLIEKLGQAWDNDPRVAYVEMGLIGYWGEQHNPYISKELQILMGDTFQSSFHNKRVMIRHYWNFSGHPYGIYWDSFAHYDRDWMAESLAEMNRWRIGVIGGETAYDYGNSYIQPGDNPTDTMTDPIHTQYLIDTIRSVHANHVGWVSDYDKSNATAITAAVNVQKALGYRYVIDQVRFPEQVNPGALFSFGFTVRNTGSSPFYYKWPVELSLLNRETQYPIWRSTFQQLDITDWLPGNHWDSTQQQYLTQPEFHRVEGIFHLPKDLPAGEYILALAILDPAGYLPSLRFAIQNYFTGGRHPICIVGVGMKPDSAIPPPEVFNDSLEDSTLHYLLTGPNTDTDGDQVADQQDTFPVNPLEWIDTDGDHIGNNADSDDDEDGMPDAWENQYHLNPLVNDAQSDTDKDGFTNLQEYDAGTNPEDQDSRPLGDVTGGGVDLEDAVIALQSLAAHNTSSKIRIDYSTSNQDVNGDNTVGMEEVIYILQKISEQR